MAGAPNAGKSTLLNRILGQKISITSKKPQTTRNRIVGVLSRPSAQFIFVDTPGIHSAKGNFNIQIVAAALAAIGDADLILLLVDATAPSVESEEILLKTLHNQSKPVILALNKIDLMPKPLLLKLIAGWAPRFAFKAIVPISAKTGEQIENLLATLAEAMPESPPFFGEDTLTDLSERFMAAEIIREKVFRLTGQEIPYAAAVTIDSFSETSPEGRVHILATIHVERGSQKGMLIGKDAKKLKNIGETARMDIQQFLDKPVFLKLFVRVQKNWRKDTRSMRRFGY